MPSEDGTRRSAIGGLEGLCARTVDSLVEGGPPSDHVEVTEHLASCLACFRMRADLADLPELFARVRALSPVESVSEHWGELARVSEASDAAFWELLPSQIADAVLQSQETGIRNWLFGAEYNGGRHRSFLENRLKEAGFNASLVERILLKSKLKLQV